MSVMAIYRQLTSEIKPFRSAWCQERPCHRVPKRNQFSSNVVLMGSES